MATENRCYFCGAAWESICQTTGFSTREGEIFRRVFRQMKIRTIARELGIKASTVREHVKRVYRRLGIHRREEMVILLLDIHFDWWLDHGPPPGCPRRMGHWTACRKDIAARKSPKEDDRGDL